MRQNRRFPDDFPDDVLPVGLGHADEYIVWWCDHPFREAWRPAIQLLTADPEEAVGLAALLSRPVGRRFDLTDDQWALLEPLLPAPQRSGRPDADADGTVSFVSLKLLPVDEVWVDRMITLASVPWERATVEAMFVEWGLARAGQSVEWEGGAGAPQVAVDTDGRWSGWSVELGAAPPDPNVWVHLPCALYWPAFGAEEPDNTDDVDEYDEEMPPLWARRPGAGRAEFHAERDRLAALITARLGTPEIVVAGAFDSYRAVWRRGDRALLLETTDDIHTYSYYDVLGIRLQRYDLSLTDLGA